MTPVLVFDLETIPDVAGIRRLGLAPDGLDDRETVAMFRRSALPKGRASSCRSTCSGCSPLVVPFATKRVFASSAWGMCFRAEDADEAQRIRQFFNAVERHVPQLVTWNGGGFDLPVLHHRAMLHGIVAPQYWDQGDHNRDFKYNNYLSRYHSRHLDLMDVWQLQWSGQRTTRCHGSALWVSRQARRRRRQGLGGFLDGRADGVAAYCETDVVNTYLLYVRFRPCEPAFRRGRRERCAWFVPRSRPRLVSRENCSKQPLVTFLGRLDHGSLSMGRRTIGAPKPLRRMGPASN